MLNKKYRLDKEKIVDVIKKGTHTNFDGFYKKTLLVKDLEYPEFTVIVPKKVNKSAVVRNKIKRRFRAAFQMLVKSGVETAQYIYVVTSDKLAETSSTEIFKIIR